MFVGNIDGVLYNYCISCFTNFTGDEKNCLEKVNIPTANFISASVEKLGGYGCHVYFSYYLTIFILLRKNINTIVVNNNISQRPRHTGRLQLSQVNYNSCKRTSDARLAADWPLQCAIQC